MDASSARGGKSGSRQDQGAAKATLSGWPLGRAIVVDDDILVRLALADALEDHGFEALTAADGIAGLQLLSETILTVNALVTDAVMPGLDGVDFVRTIRTVGGESDLCVVAITATADPLRRVALLQAGADLVLPKALGPAVISEAVEALVLGSKQFSSSSARL